MRKETGHKDLILGKTIVEVSRIATPFEHSCDGDWLRIEFTDGTNCVLMCHHLPFKDRWTNVDIDDHPAIN